MRKIALFFVATTCLSTVAFANVSSKDFLSQQRSGVPSSFNPQRAVSGKSYKSPGQEVSISSFVLKDIKVVGNHSLTKESLQEVSNDYLGKNIDSSKARELLKKVKSLFFIISSIEVSYLLNSSISL